MRVGNRLAFFNKGSSLYPSLVFGNKIYFELPRSTYKHPPPTKSSDLFLMFIFRCRRYVLDYDG